MDHEILYRPSFSLLKISLAKGEVITAEAGAMVSMSSGIEIETKMKGGLLGALKKSVLGGESFFVNNFRANEAGEIAFAPALPGAVAFIELKGQAAYAQSGAFITRSDDAFLSRLIPQLPRKSS
jgi:uncharacterized protein (TIGR00266 family)